MSKKIISEETGLIKALKLTNVKFSFAFLTKPRSDDAPYGAGTYGTDLIIDKTDKETIAMMKEYLTEVIENNSTVFGGKLPKKLPLKKCGKDEDDEWEYEAAEDNWVLKTKNKNQPALWIRMEGTKKAKRVDEDDYDEIYSGMIGEAIVAFVPYELDKKNKGITCYVNAVCKTGVGTPFAKAVDFEDEFSLEADDDENFDEEVEDTKDAKSTKKKQKIKSESLDSLLEADEVEDEEELDEEDEDDEEPVKSTKTSTSKKAKSLDDLLAE